MNHLRKVDPSDIRQNNLRLVFEEIYASGGITKAGLSESTGMSAMTAGRIADYLLEKNWITEGPLEEASGKGRPGKRLHVNRAALCNIGISLDAGGIFIGCVDPYGEILHRQHQLFAPGTASPGAKLVDTVAGLVEKFVADNGLGHIGSIGIVVPGLIDCDAGVVRVSSQLHWQNYPLAAELAGRLPGVAIVIDNDIKARAQAENRFGSAKQYQNYVLLNVGSGIGAGVVIGGQVYRGRDNLAGEIGHIVINANGRLCECGRLGCLQANLTEAAILQEARAIVPDIDMEGLLRLWQAGERWAVGLMNLVAGYLQTTINLLANTYAPEAILLCGSFIDRGAAVHKLVESTMAQQKDLLLGGQFDLCFSRLGPDGNILGAATAALNRTLDGVRMTA